MKINSYFSDNKGSIIVEAAFIFSFLSIITVGIIEYGSWLVMKSQVERVNYSIASIFRERNELYAKNDVFSNDDVKKIYELAKNLTYHRYDEGLCLRVEAIHFADSEVKKINLHQKLEYGSGLCKELSNSSLDKKMEFSPYSNRKRWLPLYQVSLIIPTPKGSLNNLLKGVDILPEHVSAHTILLAR
ncbi:tight adherence pilus pseudopilin TadF [Rosenbergiella metrosideri]|uniref:tight adherence pilus pseudopilin TadF n=1 Tax=Rosenbergiella metrosideri TaxID=2921185 RepID=UPI001F4F18D1|nr:tight adherence pilus pseudopilin TadF [Rosenbergiella metrosideri]